MAEYLIYNKAHVWDALESWEIDIIRQKDAGFLTKYNARYKKGHIIQTEKDGHWTGKNGRNFRKDVFAVISIPGEPVNKDYEKPDIKIVDGEKVLQSVRKYQFDMKEVSLTDEKAVLQDTNLISSAVKVG